MKKALALVLCLIMVAAMAVSTISADETKLIDSRELQAYGQLHFYLGDPASGSSIPDVTDGEVGEGEYQASYEAKIDPTGADPLTLWSDHEKAADGTSYGKYWDNEWFKYYVSYDEETLYLGYETKDSNFVAGKERIVHMVSLWDVGTTPGAVGRINYWCEPAADGSVTMKMQNFRKAEDGGWNWDEKLDPTVFFKEASYSYDTATEVLTIEMSADLIQLKEWWGNDLDLEDARMYWAPYSGCYGESVEGAGDVVMQGALWSYLRGDADSNIKMNFILDYPDISYWGGPMFFPHVVHFCEKPAETTPPPTTTVITTKPVTTTKPVVTTDPADKTTKAPDATTTEAPATQAPTQAPAATTAAEEGGCGGTIALSALALVPMLGAAVVIGKKKED